MEEKNKERKDLKEESKNKEEVKKQKIEKSSTTNIKNNEDLNKTRKQETVEVKEIKKGEKIVVEPNINNTSTINKNTSNSSFASKIVLSICSFVLGTFIMFLLVMLVRQVPTNRVGISNQVVKTTTLDETSDLKSGINNVYEATVYVEVLNGKTQITSGSGFVYKKDDKFGYILTNYHVIEKGKNFVVTFTDGTEATAELVSGDEYYDVAVLKVDVSKIKKVANLGDSSKLELGDTVFTVGSPLGKEYMGTITRGIISGVNRTVTVSLTSGSYKMEVIQTDASINSGNSGGPICNIRGDVIGITSSKFAGNGVEGMGFAIPMQSILSIIENVESGNKIQRPYLGVQLVDISNTFALQFYNKITIPDDVEFGAVLSLVEAGKPADKAGLKVGDVIVEVDGNKVEDVSSFKYLLYKHSVGDKVKIRYYRENKINETTLELTEAIKSE